MQQRGSWRLKVYGLGSRGAKGVVVFRFRVTMSQNNMEHQGFHVSLGEVRN